MTEQELQAYIQAIAPADGAAMTAAEKRQAALAKPPGSLGALEAMPPPPAPPTPPAPPWPPASATR